MNLHGNYTKCFMTGFGEILDAGIQEKKFIIEDISAVGGEVQYEEDIPLNQVFNIKLAFSSNFLELNLKLKAQFELNPNKSNKGSYFLRFIDLEEQKKVEIDEILKHSCIIKDMDKIDACSNGQCDFTHLNRKQK